MNIYQIITEEYNKIKGGLIKEIGDSSAKSYDYTSNEITKKTTQYKFITDLDTNYTIDIEGYYTNKFSDNGNYGIYIDFYTGDEEDGYKIENKGELFKVMATITKIIKDYIKSSSKNIDFISFIASTKRLKLYDKYLSKYNLNRRFDSPSATTYYFINNKENNKINENINKSTDITKYKFVSEIEKNNGKIYFVGGFVRDSFLNKESKDIDILVTGIPMDKLENILSKYGKVDSVGKSFGVLKFIPEGSNIDLDISIPRKEKSTGDKYTDFEVVSDHTLSIEDDLARRDYTINAIARDINGNIVDPFNGLKDLRNKTIRMVNPKAFAEDPLRMLRGIQFSSRFNFNIENETFNQIKSNASKIKSITPERILIEFDKIVKKGNPENAINNLINSGLYEYIFNAKPNISSDININKIKTMGELIFTLCYNSKIYNISEFYKRNLKGDINTTKEIKALEEIYNKFTKNRLENLLVLFNTYSIYPDIINSNIFNNNINKYINEFIKYPKTIKELDINGNDLMKLGYKGSDIRDVLFIIIKGIFNNNIKNNKDEIIKYIDNE